MELGATRVEGISVCLIVCWFGEGKVDGRVPRPTRRFREGEIERWSVWGENLARGGVEGAAEFLSRSRALWLGLVGGECEWYGRTYGGKVARGKEGAFESSYLCFEFGGLGFRFLLFVLGGAVGEGGGFS